MTIASNITKHTYTGNGVTKRFPYSFQIFSESDVKVFLTEVATGKVTRLESGYRVLTDTQEVEYPYPTGTPLAATHKITLARLIDIKQEVDLLNQGPFFAEVLEKALDLLTAIDQQQEEKLGRVFAFPLSTPNDVRGELPDPVPLHSFRWDATGKKLETTLDPATVVEAATAEKEAAQAERQAAETAKNNAELAKVAAEQAKMNAQVYASAAALATVKFGSIPYGENKPRPGFREFPCRFWRAHDGKIHHNFDFDVYKSGTEINVDSVTGLDANDGSESLPYKTLGKCFTVIAASSDTNFIIKCKSVRFDQISNIKTKTLNGKTVAIVPDNADNKVIITNHNDSGAWTDRGYNTWSQPELGYTSVFDLTYTDVYGVPIPLTNVATLTECRNTKHSWHTTGTTMYVHLHDDRQADASVVANADGDIFDVTLLNNAVLYLENVMVLHGQKTQDMIVRGNSAVQGSFITKNCAFAGGDLRITRDFGTNAVSFDNVKNVYLFDSIAAYGSEDGFNYHYYDIPTGNVRECLALEYNCISYGHGQNSTTGTSNCSTSHNGACVLRINGIYYESRGPIISDTNACYSCLYDCHSRDSLSHIESTRNAYRFSNAAQSGATAYLENCDGGGIDTYSVYNGDTADITLRAFRGTKFKDDFVCNIES